MDKKFTRSVTDSYKEGVIFGLTHYRDDFRRHVSFIEGKPDQFRLGVSDGLLIAKRELTKLVREKKSEGK